MIEIYKKNDQLKFKIDELRKSGHTIGFVPTLGALHSGHISLISRALNKTDWVVCSIFVNPTQFNDKSDFERYPRTLDSDIDLLKMNGCHMVYTPSVESIYPKNRNTSKVNLNGLDRLMEGAHRPGHFDGVVEVVERLFELVRPHFAFFGEKDFQQLAIIKQLVAEKEIPVEIIGCPIIREKDGLAMSSRNKLLTPQNRTKSGILFKALKKASLNRKELSPKALKNEIRGFLLKNNVDLEYFEIADEKKLHPINRWYKRKKVRAFIAAKFGKIRLIDNLHITYRPH